MDIESLIPHRPPFLWLDRIDSLEPGVRCVASKFIGGGAPCFAGHFPGHPILPGIFLVEAAAQAAGVMLASAENPPRTGSALLAAVNYFKFAESVLPDSTIEIDVHLGSRVGRLVQIAATISVAGRRVAAGELTLVSG